MPKSKPRQSTTLNLPPRRAISRFTQQRVPGRLLAQTATQSREARILYGRAFLPRAPGIRGAVWIERRSAGKSRVARREYQGRCGNQSSKPGTVTFATAGRDTRTTQVFINLGNNGGLDAQGFAPFGQVTDGMDVVKNLHSGYGEGAQIAAVPIRRNHHSGQSVP